MNIIRLIVILCYIILGASIGVYLLPEIVNDAGLNHLPLLTNTYFNGLLGIIIFFLIFGWFIKKATYALKELEQTIMRQSAVEILFATIGLMIGLLISVMISFIFQIIGNNVINHFVPIIVT
ncbi:PIN/TRAM domain-containing protein, partial [Staphylococcus xylosus]|nr:PIN/TRAM domain-containing protein [Staphylococcus xylosus]